MKEFRLVLAAVVAAAAFLSVWLWRAADDEVRFRGPLPAGEPVTVAGVKYRLVSLLAKEEVAEGTRLTVPVEGAVLVLAQLQYDSTDRPDELYCSFELVAGDLHWRPQFGYYPPKPDSVTCDAGSTGTVSALFEVPEKLLDRVQGVAVLPGDGSPAPVLAGRPA